ncbi:glycosyltransferase family 2 protein [Timonella senegalensis]|uniref:glycosyltransferase family 2 protein n=1 Tax=Timonella senegalensis TaxID=1465825 RepID=UPI0028AA750E|nr:glycosyltransferase family 2 protein [Timonella senegalensis]
MSAQVGEEAVGQRAERTLPKVCVVATVRNEERYLEGALESVLRQVYGGELSVVLSVGPSRDNTYGIAQEYALRDRRLTVVESPSGLIPNGLNIALSHVPSDALAVVRFDGHTRLPQGYVSAMVETLVRTGADNVGGVMHPVGTSPLEQAIAFAMSHRIGIGPASFHTGGIEGPEETAYLGTFRKEALDRVGNYDEYYERAEDWELNFRIRKSGGIVWFRPDVAVDYRPRSSFKALAKQFFHTGQWRREVMKNNRSTASLRYLAPPLAVLAITVGTLLGLVGASVGPSALMTGFAAPLGYALFALVGGLWAARELPPRARLRVPPVLATMHLCWGAGFLFGKATS